MSIQKEKMRLTYRTNRGARIAMGNLRRDLNLTDDDLTSIGVKNWGWLGSYTDKISGYRVSGARPEGKTNIVDEIAFWQEDVFEPIAKGMEEFLSPAKIATTIKATPNISTAAFVTKMFEEAEMHAKQLTSTSASVFIPKVIDRGVMDEVFRRTPAYAMIPKVAQIGKTAYVTKRTAGSTPEFVTESNAIAGTITSTDQTYGEATEDMKLMFSRGEVGHYASAVTERQINLVQQTINDHFLDFIQFKEDVLFKGQKVAAGTWGAYQVDVNGYDGIAEETRAAASTPPVHVEKSSGNFITTDDFDTAIEEVSNRKDIPDVIFCDDTTLTRLKKDARLQERSEPLDINFGKPGRRINFDGVPVLSTAQLSRATDEKSLFAITLESMQYRVLLPDTLKIEAEVANDSLKFQWKTYEALLIPVPTWNYAVVAGA
jgi:hypothetical protein